jgi:hypothetical protein
MRPFNMWAVARLKAQRPLGEWLGMTVYTFIGISANLAAVTSSSEALTMEGQYWAWGFATMIGKFILTVSFVQTSRSRHDSWKYFTPDHETTLTSAPTGIYISSLLRSSAASHGVACRFTS